MSSMKDDRLCPVLFSIGGGFLVVMPRCDELTEGDFLPISVNYRQFCNSYNKNGVIFCDLTHSVENKIDSFGWYKRNQVNHKVVAIDYAD